MLQLYLIRHAKSDWGDPSLADHDRPLAPRGIRAARAMGAYLSDLLKPDLVLCSTARRAVETLKLMAAAAKADWPVVTEPQLYMASAQELMHILQTAAGSHENVAIIGHNPGLQDFATLLSKNRGDALYADVARKLPTGSVVCLEFDTARFADIRLSSAKLYGFYKPRDLPQVSKGTGEI